MNNRALRFCIYFYLVSILFDGVFRKWVFPLYSTPIMLLKQVVAILIILYGFQYLSKSTIWEKSFALLGVVVFCTSMMFGHQNILVAFYGCLPYWFGLTICFIIGKALTYDDLLLIGRIMMYATIANSILLILQFNSPVTSFINYQSGSVDNDIVGYSVSSLEGGFRPSGLFVYNSQNALFQMLSLAFMLFFLFLRPIASHRRLVIVSLILNFISLPFTVSRTSVFFQLGLVVFFVLFCMKNSQRKKLLLYIPVGLVVVALALTIPEVKTAVQTIAARFANASSAQFEGSTTWSGTLKDVWYRNVVYMVTAIIDPHTIDGDAVPFWGFGQGMSTQVGSRFLGITKNSGFALAEWDGLRIMCESGMILGWMIIFVRVAYAFRFIFRINEIRRSNKLLALTFLFPFLVSFYLLNNWGNLFQSNISFLIGGLFFAGMKYRIYNGDNVAHDTKE